MSTISRFLAIFAIIAVTVASPVIAQVNFEVASIHPSRPGAGPRDGRIYFSGDSFIAEASTVSDILDMLDGWQLFRVVGGPPWMTTDRFDIHAKASASIPPEEQHRAVMALLAERFHLSVHHETRDVPATLLLPPKNPAALRPSAAGEHFKTDFNDRGDLTFVATSMSVFTNRLSQLLQQPVSDQTGLQGNFDFSLNLSEAASQPGESFGDRIRAGAVAAGFKMEEKKVPMDVTVVDHCDRPSEN